MPWHEKVRQPAPPPHSRAGHVQLQSDSAGMGREDFLPSQEAGEKVRGRQAWEAWHRRYGSQAQAGEEEEEKGCGANDKAAPCQGPAGVRHMHAHISLHLLLLAICEFRV